MADRALSMEYRGVLHHLKASSQGARDKRIYTHTHTHTNKHRRKWLIRTRAMAELCVFHDSVGCVRDSFMCPMTNPYVLLICMRAVTQL